MKRDKSILIGEYGNKNPVIVVEDEFIASMFNGAITAKNNIYYNLDNQYRILIIKSFDEKLCSKDVDMLDQCKFILIPIFNRHNDEESSWLRTVELQIKSFPRFKNSIYQSFCGGIDSNLGALKAWIAEVELFLA